MAVLQKIWSMVKAVASTIIVILGISGVGGYRDFITKGMSTLLFLTECRCGRVPWEC